MASGERITVTYARTAQRTPLQLDVYTYAPPVDPNDPSPTFTAQQRLPFLLFLHGGHFLTGSRRDVPPWLASLARSMGVPLLCADYRLAPHAGPSHAWADITQLWRFIAEELNWIIAASGNGADVESGSEPLDRGLAEIQRRGGIDVAKGIVFGAGSGGYLAAMGGALLSPAPLAVVLGYPLLEFGDKTASATKGYEPPINLPDRLAHILHPSNVGQVQKAKSDVPDMPMLLQRAPYALEVRARAGMDLREPWRGLQESRKRSGIIGMLLQHDCFNSLMTSASPDLVTPREVVEEAEPSHFASLASVNLQRHRNRPYPPTLIFHGLKDTRTPFSSSLRFLDALRRAEPAAAALDAFSASDNIEFSGSSGSASKSQSLDASSSTSPLHVVSGTPNHTARYLFVGIDGHNAGHAFDTLLPRTLSTTPAPSMGAPSHRGPTIISDRYRASMSHVESFIKHWMNEGSAALAQTQNRELQRLRRQEAGSVDRPPKTQDATLTPHAAIGGARIRVPARGPRL